LSGARPADEVLPLAIRAEVSANEEWIDDERGEFWIAVWIGVPGAIGSAFASDANRSRSRVR
jgi:hypothetical protein